MLKLVFENSLQFYNKKSVLEKVILFENSKVLYFLLGGCTDYHIWPILRHLSFLTEICSFATFININQKL